MQTSNFSSIALRTTKQLKSITNKTNDKIKGTFLEKWVKYWKLVGRDYTEVAISVKQDIKEKPIKAAFTFAGLSTLAYCATHNPNKQHFRAKYVECSNDLSLVAPNIVNPEAVRHLKYIEQCYNANLIRRTSFGICSIIWVDKHSNECSTYESSCSYLQWQYRKFTERIIDFGFLNIWWVISRKMLDYDINY